MRELIWVTSVVALGMGCQDLRVAKDAPEGGTGSMTAGHAAAAGGTGGSVTAAAAGGNRAQGGAGGRSAAAGVNAGAGGAASASSEDCANPMTLPQDIKADMSVGPGCVQIPNHTTVSGARLTIAPGTKLLMGSNAYLSATMVGGIVAKGTVDAPIVFTSAAAEPMPGDWGCVGLSNDADSSSAFDYVTFEYAGAPCRRDGSSYTAALALDVSLRTLTHAKFQHNQSAGLGIRSAGDIGDFSNVAFADNDRTPIRVPNTRLTSLGEGLKFDADDHIQVESGSNTRNAGTIRTQTIPFHFSGSTSLGAPGVAIAIEAGNVFKFNSGSLSIEGELDVKGTADAPVRFTSVHADPAPGDWGCVFVLPPNLSLKFDHTIFEYGGSGQGCTGASYKVALVANNASTITNSRFEKLPAHAIQSPLCNDKAALCANVIDVPEQKLICGSMPTDCP